MQLDPISVEPMQIEPIKSETSIVQLNGLDGPDLISAVIVHGLITMTLINYALTQAGVIDMPWWEIIAPLWIPLAVILIVTIVAAICKAAADAIIKSTRKHD